MELAPDRRLQAFAEHRPLLFSIAYRMLGSAADAEDLVQDAYLRWLKADAADVRSPKDFLSTTVTRLAVDHLRSARVRREVYVGPWLPEPLLGVDERDPIAHTELAESLSTAFLLLLERLTPTQRAAYLLREVFGYEYGEVARMLDASEANCRQLVQRARQAISGGKPRFSSDARAAQDLARRFLDACTTGDMDALVGLLTEDAVAWSDGGGKFSTARHPIEGADRVARFLAGVMSKWRASGDVRIDPVNGGLGLSFHVRGTLRGVMTLDAGAELVGQVFIVMNPDKLGDGPA